MLTLVDQTAEFVDNLSPAPSDAPWTADNSLFALWFGVNDIGNSYWLSNETEVINAIFDSYFAQAQLLYKAGARSFLFVTCPRKINSPRFNTNTIGRRIQVLMLILLPSHR